MLRVPLHLKVMVSYLLVVGLVFVPTFLYLRTAQRQQLREGVQRQLVEELDGLAGRLSRVAPEDEASTFDLLVDLQPHRLTVLDADGLVRIDSHEGVRPGEDRSSRPEVAAALTSAEGRGFAIRTSDTTGKTHLYVARRYPLEGRMRGVLRLAVPLQTVDAANRSGAQFLNRAAAVALSAAVLLSLVAAVVVSRPLRRITDAARAYAAGDFGYPVEISGTDELADAARALSDLAGQLRGRLLSAGADRAALHALLDELPVGVVLFDVHRTPVALNGVARRLCDLNPRLEFERATALLSLPGSEAAVSGVLADGRARSVELHLPWIESGPLLGRWVAVFGTDGERQPALIVVGPDGASSGAVREALCRAQEVLRTLARGDQPRRVDAWRALESVEDVLQPPHIDPAGIHAVSLDQLSQQVSLSVETLRADRGALIHWDLPEPSPLVAEGADRCVRALAALVSNALENQPPGTPVAITGELEETQVRVWTHQARHPRQWEAVGRSLQALGGAAFHRRTGDGFEVGLWLPRA